MILKNSLPIEHQETIPSKWYFKNEYLEIEKRDIEEKYRVLVTEHETLRKKIKDEKLSQRHKELKFNEKIDELNQETDILLEEIDKWQM